MSQEVDPSAINEAREYLLQYSRLHIDERPALLANYDQLTTRQKTSFALGFRAFRESHPYPQTKPFRSFLDRYNDWYFTYKQFIFDWFEQNATPFNTQLKTGVIETWKGGIRRLTRGLSRRRRLSRRHKK